MFLKPLNFGYYPNLASLKSHHRSKYLQNLDANRGLKLVAIGGGTGLSTLLSGLKRFVGENSDGTWLESLSAIVTVSDDGGSSGRLREELQMLPPGDIRN